MNVPIIFRRSLKAIYEGEFLPPWYYGYCYHEWYACRDVFAPIPLNYLLRWHEWLKMKWDRWRGQSSDLDRRIHNIVSHYYSRGRDQGQEHGIERAWKMADMLYSKIIMDKRK